MEVRVLSPALRHPRATVPVTPLLEWPRAGPRRGARREQGPADRRGAERTTSSTRSSTPPPTSPRAQGPRASARARCRCRYSSRGSARSASTAEAVESHIGAGSGMPLAGTRVRPITRPAYDYDLPERPSRACSFTATVDVQPEARVPDWTKLEVPAREAEVPEELVDEQLELLRIAVAELVPVDRRRRPRATRSSSTSSESSQGDAARLRRRARSRRASSTR